MEAKCTGSKFEFDLSPTDAAGLYAVLTGNPSAVTPEQYQIGQTVYTWFFGEVQRLATGVAPPAATALPVKRKATKKVA